MEKEQKTKLLILKTMIKKIIIKDQKKCLNCLINICLVRILKWKVNKYSKINLEN